MKVLGIDIGGTGIKGAIVNVKTGELVSERYRIPTPRPALPRAVSKTVSEIVHHFDWKGPIGCGFPTTINNGQSTTASNMHVDWLDLQVDQLFSEAIGQPTHVINDADAAGLAEITFGAGKEKKGLVIVITLGTGIGSSVFLDGKLTPNVELGRILYQGDIIEKFVADSTRKREDLSFKEFGKRVNIFLEYLNNIFVPDLYILGGGVSKKMHKFEKQIKIKTPTVAATARNNAGIIGAALAAVRIHS